MREPSKNTSFPANPEPQTPGLSIWEKLGWIRDPDAVVVGTGIVGMNTALELRSLHPDWHIVMFDRSAFGGASTRNAGFACFGSPSELVDDLEALGPDALFNLVNMRWFPSHQSDGLAHSAFHPFASYHPRNNPP